MKNKVNYIQGINFINLFHTWCDKRWGKKTQKMRQNLENLGCNSLEYILGAELHFYWAKIWIILLFQIIGKSLRHSIIITSPWLNKVCSNYVWVLKWVNLHCNLISLIPQIFQIMTKDVYSEPCQTSKMECWTKKLMAFSHWLFSQKNPC